MSIIGNIGGQSGGGSLTKSVLIIAAPTGSTVTVTKGGATKTATEKNGEWWFKNLENGEWTIRAELDGQNATEVFNITQFGVYRRSISYRMTPEFTYTGDYEIVQDDDTPIADFANWKGNWKIRFLTSGDFTITNMHGFAGGVIDVFLVGAGGAGGPGTGGQYNNGGRGGGSGYTSTALSVTLDRTTYHIEVGAGGTGDGGNTTSFGITANGGKSGATSGDGGSGGGAAGYGDDYYNNNGSKGGTDGKDGEPTKGNAGNSVGKGQHTTTREFGDLSGKLYATGGGGDGTSRNTDGMPNTGNGGGGPGRVSKPGTPGGSGIVVIRNSRT